MKRTATAVWNGPGKEGSGKLTTQTNTLKDVPYDWRSRFADGNLTNPEELIAAAHAGCYSMKLSFVLEAAGFVPDSIETTSIITLDGVIRSSALETKVKVAGISEAEFQDCAKEAKENCPVSKALSVEITLNAILL